MMHFKEFSHHYLLSRETERRNCQLLGTGGERLGEGKWMLKVTWQMSNLALSRGPQSPSLSEQEAACCGRKRRRRVQCLQFMV